MKLIKFILIVLSIILLINNVDAYTVAYTTSPFGNYGLNVTKEHTNLTSQIILKFPKQALSGINQVNGIRFLVERGYKDGKTPNGNLIIRMYKYKGSTTFEYVDNFIIPNNTCIECYINAIFDNVIYTGESFNNNYDGVAFGIYTTATSGIWDIRYSVYDYSGNNIYNKYLEEDTGYKISIKDINNNLIYDSNYNKYMLYKHASLLGSFFIPPTPEPTPTIIIPNADGEEPLPQDCTWTDFLNEGCGLNFSDTYDSWYLPDNYTPDFSNISNTSCPECLGNETFITPDGNLAKEKPFSQVLIGFGYCDSNGCDIYDLLDFMNDFTLFLFLISIIMLFIKIGDTL